MHALAEMSSELNGQSHDSDYIGNRLFRASLMQTAVGIIKQLSQLHTRHAIPVHLGSRAALESWPKCDSGQGTIIRQAHYTTRHTHTSRENIFLRPFFTTLYTRGKFVC